MLLWSRGRARVRSAPTRTRRLVAGLLGVVLLAGAALVSVLGARPAFPGEVRASVGEHVALPDYGERGSLVVRYRHDEAARVELQVTNAGLLPITVQSVEPFLTTLGLLTVEAVTVNGASLPVRLGPRESADVRIDATFGHCAYFTERAIDPSTHARVTWTVLGLERTALVAYPQALLVRSPTIVDCPGRVLDRGAMQRNRDATITGRG